MIIIASRNDRGVPRLFLITGSPLIELAFDIMATCNYLKHDAMLCSPSYNYVVLARQLESVDDCAVLENL